MRFAFAWTVTQVPWHLCLSERVEKEMTRYLVTENSENPCSIEKIVVVSLLYKVLARQRDYFLLLLCLTIVGRESFGMYNFFV